MALLSPDVVLISDGGRNRHAARRPVVRPDRVARLLVGIGRRGTDARMYHQARLTEVNGDRGLVVAIDGRTELVITFEFAPGGLIRRIFIQLNPDKLKHLS
jgi:RNA polymerase sigma-70 factor (ECF subfamily)